MLNVEKKLAHWRTCYGELCEAEERMRLLQERRPADPAVTSELDAQLLFLQQRANSALDAVGEALEARREAEARNADSKPT